MLDLRNTHRKKFVTQEIPTRKRFRPTKYPQQKSLDPRHSHNKKFWTHKIPARKDFGPLKYPQKQMTRDPQIQHNLLFIYIFIYLFIYLLKLYLPLAHKIAFADNFQLYHNINYTIIYYISLHIKHPQLITSPIFSILFLN